MADRHIAPGVFVEERLPSPGRISPVETAVPVFIGYTERTKHKGDDLVFKSVPITSLADFVEKFGGARHTNFRTLGSDGIRIKKSRFGLTIDDEIEDPFPSLSYRLYYNLLLYFMNGGGSCFVISCGTYAADNSVQLQDMETALNAAAENNNITLIVFSDATSLPDSDDFYLLQRKALQQCSHLNDRFLIVDVHLDRIHKGASDFNSIAGEFRQKIGNEGLSYGAAYYPWLQTDIGYYTDESLVKIIRGEGISRSEIPDGTVLRLSSTTGRDRRRPGRQARPSSLFHHKGELYDQIKDVIGKFKIIAPPSSAIAGVYCKTDKTRGVWKAPANTALNLVTWPTVQLNDQDQEGMNVHQSGKSINAIRYFTGRGTLVWGARTLRGNDNEWRYVPVRRFFIMVEQSIHRSLQYVVFEPNNANTWNRMKGTVENFLLGLWRNGALAGRTPEEAFFVNVGLGSTMTTNDITNGKIVLEAGLAVVRPAEFTIFRLSYSVSAA